MSDLAKGKSLSVALLGIAVLALGALALVDLPAIQDVHGVIETISAMKPGVYNLLTPYTVGAAVVLLVIGGGLLARKRWAWRTGRIVLPAALVSWPLAVAASLGWPAVLAFKSHIVLMPVGAASLYVLSRPWIREEFCVEGAAFSRLSRVALAGLAGAVLLPLVFVTGIRIAIGSLEDGPTATQPLKEVRLPAGGDAPAGFRRVELPMLSLRLPAEFSVVETVHAGEAGFLLIAHAEGRDKGWVAIHPGIDVPVESGFRRFGYRNSYDVWRAIYGNRWSPLFTNLRLTVFPSGVVLPIEAFDGERTRGFISTVHYAKEDRHSRWANVHRKDGQASAVDITFSAKSPGIEKEDVYRVLSSVEFRGQSKADAPRLFEEGRSALERGDIPEAQFKLAAAYLADPATPEHMFLLAKAAARAGERGARLARRLADKTLKAVPDHKGARELLKGLGPEDGKKP